MDYVAVFVDAGYLFAEGSKLLAGRRLQRGEIRLDIDAIVKALSAFANEASGPLPLLRIYWYDGTAGEPSFQHRLLARHDHMKVRLGIVNSQGKQKGVDSLLVTDMITLARNGAIAECVLLSGDEDMRVGVLLAQEHGVRVHLLGVAGASRSQSELLVQEADQLWEWGEDDLRPFFTCTPRPHAADAATGVSLTAEDIQQELSEVAREAAQDVPAAERTALISEIEATQMRPRSIDAPLLARSATAIGEESLSSHQRRQVRDAFLAHLVELEEAEPEPEDD